MKLGVYIATHNQPYFLRSCLLQLERQDRQPSVIAIHENGHTNPYLNWSCDDILPRLSHRSEILFAHSPVKLPAPFFHYLPLKQLVDAGCTRFVKFDHDDIFKEDHLSNLEYVFWKLSKEGQDSDFHWVGNLRSGVTILRTDDCEFYDWVDFGQFNPIGGMSDAFMFDRAVAEQYLQDMRDVAGSGLADDWILHKYTLPKFRGELFDGKPTSVYVSHGRNTSTAHWMKQTPAELLKG